MNNLALAVGIALAFCAGARAAVLTTTFADDNAQNGNMFDVVTKETALTLTGFDLHLANGSHIVELYRKNGSWAGADKDAGAWTLAGRAALVAHGGATFFDVADFRLDALSTSGLYLTSVSPLGSGVMLYTDGTEVGKVAAENGDLQILEGAGNQYAFAATFTPRIWNGAIHYRLADDVAGAVPEPGSLALLGLGLAGVSLLRRRAR